MGASAYLRFAALFAVLTAFLLLVGYVVSYYFLGFGSLAILAVMVSISIIVNAVSYFYGPQMMLRLSKARFVSANELPHVHSALTEISQSAGIATPRLALADQPQPNAFTTGRGKNNSVIVVTKGLVSTMNDNEMKAVLAHEVGHVIHRDISLSTAASTVATTITYMADLVFFSMLFGGGGRRGGGAGIFAALLAPVAATMVQLAISRGREFYADEASAKLTGRPDYLISALTKIEQYIRRGVPMTASPTTSSMWISNPFRGGSADWFSTHPATQKRIKRLQDMQRKSGVYYA